jgi:DNA-directed RNA polymerase subunit RPC12/RpoP
MVMRGKYAVVECAVCGSYLALDVRIGYRKCPYCGYVNKMGVSRVIKVFNNPRDASELVKELNGSSNTAGFKQLG